MANPQPERPYRFRRGKTPLLVSVPHNGSTIPDAIGAMMSQEGRSSQDTDWFVEKLYDVPEIKDASLLVADISRYVIDLNRPEDDTSLYPGQTTTGLIPEVRFDGKSIYRDQSPDEEDIFQRMITYWRPYHETLRLELERMVSEHSIAVLLDAHSIGSTVPRLFPGKLPDFNIGTNDGLSCDPRLADALVNILKSQEKYSFVLNGRFKGGYITRNYGNPSRNIHAIQIELSQATYLNESDQSWNEVAASDVRIMIRKILASIHEWIPTHASKPT